VLFAFLGALLADRLGQKSGIGPEPGTKRQERFAAITPTTATMIEFTIGDREPKTFTGSTAQTPR
jgi:hypothetical protein